MLIVLLYLQIFTSVSPIFFSFRVPPWHHYFLNLDSYRDDQKGLPDLN